MDQSFCGVNKPICLLSMAECIIYMGFFLYKYKVISTAWLEMKAKENLLKSFTLRYKILWVTLLIISSTLELSLNQAQPNVIIIPITCQLIVYLTMIKILYEDNKYFNQSRQIFRRFIRYPFIFQLLQTMNMVLLEKSVYSNLFTLLLLFTFYEYLVDKSCNLQVKDLKKHVDNCEKLNIICNSKQSVINIKNKTFLDDSPNLNENLIQQSNQNRDTASFQQGENDNEYYESDDNENQKKNILVSFGVNIINVVSNFKIIQQLNDKIIFEYIFKGKKVKKEILIDDIQLFLNLFQLETFEEIINNQQILDQFGYFLDSKNIKEWCDLYERNTIIETFQPTLQL